MKKIHLPLLGLTAAMAASASAATLVSLSTFGGGDGWRAPNEIIAGDTTGTATGLNYNYLKTGSNERGLAFNPVTGNLILVSRSAADGIRVLSGTSGADIGSLAQGTGIITGGTFATNQVGVADDGVIYVGNLTTNTSTSALKVYSWANESSTATLSPFGGGTITPPSGTLRLGDSFDVTGSGAGTRIVAGSSGVTGYVVFSSSSTTNISSFSPTGPATGDFRLGITFAGSATDVWGKQTGVSAAAAPLRETSYSTTGSATGFATLTSAGEMAMDYKSIDGVPYLATLDANSSIVRVYDVTNPTAPVLSASATTTSGSLTSNGNGAGSLKWGASGPGGTTLYAMSSNQGIQALVFVPEPSAAVLGLLGLGVAFRRRRSC